MEKKQSQTGRLVRSIFNPKVWMDYETVRNSTFYLKDGMSKLFRLQKKNQNVESFEETIAQMGLDEEKLNSQKKALFRLSLLMVLLALLVFGYSLGHLLEQNYHAAAASFVIFLVVLAMGFRYHFWYYQLKERTLGCGIKEWFRRGLLGAKK